ncbi:MAG TPA: hypothetical protein VFX18_02600 [Candidatus Nitrosocosmicus sp.]|nr:hypothetical protein [Candidatus Nitrosocosmicus sp.]
MSAIKVKECKYCDKYIYWDDEIERFLNEDDDTPHKCNNRPTEKQQKTEGKGKMCKNEGCNTMLYWDNNERKMREVNNGEIHRCQHWNNPLTVISSKSDNPSANKTIDASIRHGPEGTSTSEDYLRDLVMGQNSLMKLMVQVASNISNIETYTRLTSIHAEQIQQNIQDIREFSRKHYNEYHDVITAGQRRETREYLDNKPKTSLPEETTIINENNDQKTEGDAF